MSEENVESVESVESTSEAVEAAERPDYIPERFWDSETGAPNVENLGKSYNELNSKFGGFTGAPKDGYAPIEGFKEGDELVSAFTEYASKINMNQEAFSEGWELLSTALGVDKEVTVENELAKLGDNAQQRIDKVDNYLKNNLPEKYERFEELLQTSTGVELLEEVMLASAQPKLNGDDPVGGKGLTLAEVNEAAFKRDEHGNLLRSIDPAYDKKIIAMYAQVS
jgi:hypothetical protein